MQQGDHLPDPRWVHDPVELILLLGHVEKESQANQIPVPWRFKLANAKRNVGFSFLLFRMIKSLSYKAVR